MERLATSGRTIDVKALSGAGQAVEINFGFGRELWLVDGSWPFDVDPKLAAFQRGRLIVDDGKPVRNVALVSARGLPIERVSVRF